MEKRGGRSSGTALNGSARLGVHHKYIDESHDIKVEDKHVQSTNTNVWGHRITKFEA
jgi:hypothetical protein